MWALRRAPRRSILGSRGADIVTSQAGQGPRDAGPPDRRLRLSDRLFLVSYAGLALVTALAVVAAPSPADSLVLALVVVLGVAALLERRAVAAVEARRLGEAASFARILS